MNKLIMSEVMYVQALTASFMAGVLLGRSNEKEGLAEVLKSSAVLDLFKVDPAGAMKILTEWCVDDNDTFLNDVLPKMAEEPIPETNWAEMEGVQEVAPNVFEVSDYKILKQWLEVQQLQKTFNL